MQQMSHDEYQQFMMHGTRTGKLATVRKDGLPHVVPIWFMLDGDDLIFMTGERTVKGYNMRRDGRVCLCVDEETPPYAFVQVTGTVQLSDNLDEMLHWGTRIGGRYMGEELAETFGRRNAVAGEMLVRLIPHNVLAFSGVAD